MTDTAIRKIQTQGVHHITVEFNIEFDEIGTLLARHFVFKTAIPLGNALEGGYSVVKRGNHDCSLFIMF